MAERLAEIERLPALRDLELPPLAGAVAEPRVVSDEDPTRLRTTHARPKGRSGWPVLAVAVLVVLALDRPGKAGQISNVELRGVADNSLELRQVKPGLTAGELVAVRGNISPGDKVVTKGSLFIDRAASSGS